MQFSRKIEMHSRKSTLHSSPTLLPLLLLFVVSVRGWTHGHTARCERLNVGMCRGLRYNLTGMPNFMGHEDQRQAERGLTAFMPLIHYNCSRHLRLFLCSVFAPVCSEHAALQIPACKSLCLSVRRDCEPALTSLTLPWPHLLDCGRFLDRGNTLCVQPPEDGEETAPSIRPALLGQWPIAVEKTANGQRPGHQCPPHFIQTPDVKTMSCSPKCGMDAYYRTSDKNFAGRWTFVWACLSFLSTLFTLLTFWVEPSRFRYPERPVIFLALSYNLLSATYIARAVLGGVVIACAAGDDGRSYVPIHDGLRSLPCTLWFLSSYYVGLAACCWWALLACCWLLSAARDWGSEALQASSPYIHAVGWGVPLLFSAGVLMKRHVVADELTGTCHVTDSAALTWEAWPRLALLLIGCAAGGVAAAALFRVRRLIRAAGRDPKKLERLMKRLAVFCALYVVPALGWLACTVHESRTRPRWRTLALLAALDCRSSRGCQPGPRYAAAGLEVGMMKHFLSLAAGVTSGMWVWSGKTCRAWSRLLAAPTKAANQSADTHGIKMEARNVG